MMSYSVMLRPRANSLPINLYPSETSTRASISKTKRKKRLSVVSERKYKLEREISPPKPQSFFSRLFGCDRNNPETLQKEEKV